MERRLPGGGRLCGSQKEILIALVLRRLDYRRLIQRLVAESRNREETAAHERRGGLSSREASVLALAADGLTTRRIAERLGLSTHTVKNHFANILAKLEVHSRAEAVSLALRRSLI